MVKIAKLYAREILDSRAMPTVETVAILDDGHIGVASVPSGASTGTYEAHELRDLDMSRYLGNGVLKAVNNVNTEIAGKLIGVELTSLLQVDQILIKLDGTPEKSRLGANATLSVSISVAKALAASQKIFLYKFFADLAENTDPLYIPSALFNMINGGKHGAGNLDFQEFWVIPSRLHSFSENLETSSVIYHNIKKILARRGAIHSVGDEGGFAPNLFTNLDALEVLTESIINSGRKPNVDVELGLDIAANSFYKDGRYIIKDRSSPMEANEFTDYLRDLNGQYHLKLLEDPLYEDDWKGWAVITAELGTSVGIVGDDLLVTNKSRVEKATKEHACNTVLIKPNQIGTITETIEVIKQVRKANWKVIVSHRSGETNDTFIADFAVGVGADFVKFGAPARGERVAKYNRLLSIETEIKI